MSKILLIFDLVGILSPQTQRECNDSLGAMLINYFRGFKGDKLIGKRERDESAKFRELGHYFIDELVLELQAN